MRITGIFLVLLVLSGGITLAQEPFRVAGELRGDYDQISVEQPSGGRKSTGFFGQSYMVNMGGPLMNDNLGSAQAVFTHTQGENLAQSVDGRGSGGFRTTGMNFSSNLLNGDVKKYITLAPFYDRRTTTAIWGDSPRTMIDTTTGATVGMTLPSMPSVRVTRQVAGRRGTNGEAFADAPGTTATNIASLYKAGPALFEYSQEIRTTVGIPGSPETSQDVITGRTSVDDPNFNQMGVKGYNTRFEYFGNGTRGSINTVGQRRVSQSGGFSTVEKEIGVTSNYFSYSESVSHDLVSRSNFFSQETGLITGYRSRGLDATNRVKHQYAPPGNPWMNRVSDQQNLELGGGGLRTRYSLMTEEGYSWSGKPGSGRDNREEQRISVRPIKRVETWVQQAYSAGWSGDIPRLSSLLSGGGGASFNPVNPLDLKASYEHVRNWFPAAARRDSDRGTGEVRVRPLDNLDFGTSYTHEVSRDAGPYENRMVTGTISFDTGWSPLEGLRTSATAQHVSRSGEGTSQMRPSNFNLMGRASYTLGQTTASLVWESQKLATASPYTRMSASLARTF